MCDRNAGVGWRGVLWSLALGPGRCGGGPPAAPAPPGNVPVPSSLQAEPFQGKAEGGTAVGERIQMSLGGVARASEQ